MRILVGYLLYGIYISHLLKWTQNTNKIQLHFMTLLMKPMFATWILRSITIPRLTISSLNLLYGFILLVTIDKNFDFEY